MKKILRKSWKTSVTKEALGTLTLEEKSRIKNAQKANASAFKEKILEIKNKKREWLENQRIKKEENRKKVLEDKKKARALKKAKRHKLVIE